MFIRQAPNPEPLLQERGMITETAKPKVWTRPQIKRLGEIKDVAGAQGAGAQAAGVKT